MSERSERGEKGEQLDRQAAAMRQAAQACLAIEALRQTMTGVLEQRARAIRLCHDEGMGPREITDGVEALCTLWKQPAAAVSYETVRGDLRMTRGT